MHVPICDRVPVWLDTETTGLDPNDNDIIEFYGIKDTGEELYFKIFPERPDSFSDRGMEFSQYTREYWAEDGAVEMTEAIHQIADFLVDTVLCGQNISFDENFIKATMKRHGVQTRIGYHKVDVATLAYVHLVPLGMQSVSLEHVCDVLGIPNTGAHTAKADVRRTQRAYAMLVEPRPGDLAVWNDRIRVKYGY